MYLVSSLEASTSTVFSEDDVGNKALRTAGAAVVWFLAAFTSLGAFSMLDATNKCLLRESEVRSFGGAALLGNDDNVLCESLGENMDLELLERSVDGELPGVSEDPELVRGNVHCEVVDRCDNRELTGERIPRGPRTLPDALDEGRRNLAFLSSFRIHRMKRQAAVESFDLPSSDENTFRSLIKDDEHRRSVMLHFSLLSSASSGNGFKCSG
jgi:hypothetical protein